MLDCNVRGCLDGYRGAADKFEIDGRCWRGVVLQVGE